MVIHVIYSGKVISVRAVEDSVALHEAKLIALRAAVIDGDVTASQALQVTFELIGGKPI